MHIAKKQSNLSGRRFRAIKRVRAKILGTPQRPRLAVFRSLTSMSGQMIDDTTQTTLVGVYGHELKGKKMTKTESAKALGKMLGLVW